MTATGLEETLREVLENGHYSSVEVHARLSPLRLGVATGDLLEDFFVCSPQGWSLRTVVGDRLVREKRAALSDKQKGLLKDWFHARLREAQQALEVSGFLDTLATEEREQIPFDWLEDAKVASRVHQLSRLLRHDPRFMRYEGCCFGLAEWDDAIHLRYWWRAMEAAYHRREVTRFEQCAARVEALSLPEGQRARLNCVLATYRGQLAKQTTPCLSQSPPSAIAG